MDQQDATTTPVNGASTARDLFLLTDEQILKMNWLVEGVQGKVN